MCVDGSKVIALLYLGYEHPELQVNRSLVHWIPSLFTSVTSHHILLP